MSRACNLLLSGALAALLTLPGVASGAVPAPACANPVYLTVDPGSMDYAPRVAEILRRQQVLVTYWVSNQPTRNGEGSLGNQWGDWWKQIAQQGHEFASQTYDHVAWRGDLPGYKPTFRVKLGSGSLAGREFTYDPPKYCAQVERAARRIEDFTGKKSLPLFHAPGGGTSPKLLAAGSACGYAHVGLGEPGLLANATPLKKAVEGVRSGDVLMLNLNPTSAADPWALANLEPLIAGLRERGLCFASLRQHPAYKDWIGSHGG
jgi:peptidoglycan/xylan/chitin deacetylase (PgdA/CDA1 family)